jgi:hypothetical protein
VFEVYGLQGLFLATVTPLFWGLRAPRTFLGDRYTSFLGFAGSKDLSWRPSHLFFGVCGLQGSFLATVSPLFWGLRAPRTFLGDRYTSFFPFAGSRDLSWRPVHLFFSVCGLQGSFLATGKPLFFRFRGPRTFLGVRYSSFFLFTGSKDLSLFDLDSFDTFLDTEYSHFGEIYKRLSLLFYFHDKSCLFLKFL